MHIYEEIPAIVSPSKSHAPYIQEELYEMPVLSDPATNVPSDKEGLYEEKIEYVKGKFNPSQMDAVAIYQSMKDSISEDKTKTSGPPPDYPPPPPPPDGIVEIYPDLEDDDGIEDEDIYEPHKAMSKPKPVNENKTKTSGPSPYYQTLPPTDVYKMQGTETEIYSELAIYQNVVENPATNKKKPPPVAQKPRHFREFYPSKNPSDLQELRK